MKSLIVANWKMHPAVAAEVHTFLRSLKKKQGNFPYAEIVVAPPFPFLGLFPKKASWSLGAQDMFWDSEGAYTGEVSGSMLKGFGVRYVIIGHSERRRFASETNEIVNKKIRQALKIGLSPILCVGEVVRDPDGAFFNFVGKELTSALAGVKSRDLAKITIAYEPVWAISGGGALKAAKPADANEAALFIHKTIARLYNPELARRIRVLYGGSVDGTTAGAFLEEREINGLLVGRESRNFKTFEPILRCTN